MNRAYIGIGTNIDPRLPRMQQGIARLAEIGSVVSASSIYETPPFGYTDQPEFLNAVVCLDTKVDSTELHRQLKALELDLGRQHREHWHEREIDFDLLFFNEEIVATASLTIPHPGVEQRLFVLVPLAEIAPGLIHPVSKKSIRQSLEGLGEHSPAIHVYSSIQTEQNS